MTDKVQQSPLSDAVAHAKEQKMMKFRKKPVVIDAVQWDGSIASAKALQDLVMLDGRDLHSGTVLEFDGAGLYVNTLEGRMEASHGDWIIRGIKGEFYPCKPDIFAASYEPVAALSAPPSPVETDQGSVRTEGRVDKKQVGLYGRDEASRLRILRGASSLRRIVPSRLSAAGRRLGETVDDKKLRRDQDQMSTRRSGDQGSETTLERLTLKMRGYQHLASVNRNHGDFALAGELDQQAADLETAIDALLSRAVLRPPQDEAAPSHGWRTMDSAPKNGTKVLLFTDANEAVIASWQQVEDFETWIAEDEFDHPDSWEGATCWNDISSQPTYWIPAPPPVERER